MKNPFKILRNQKGIALLIAVFCVMLISFIAIEVSQDSTVEYIIANNEVKRLKAYYAAKSGLEISLLRIAIYKQAIQQFGKTPGVNSQMIDQIWTMPFAWPVQIPEGATRVTKEEMTDSLKESLMDSEYFTSISSEGSKIDLNDLVSPSKVLADSTKQQVVQIIQGRLDADDQWSKDNQNMRPEEIVNNIIDWMDRDTESLNGGDESSNYRDIPDGDKLPPNQAFKTLDELRMVELVTEDVFNMLSPRVTVYGIKGVQVNHASKEVLRSLDPQITEEIATTVLERRNDPLRGPFKDAKDFYGHLQGEGVDTKKLEDSKMPLVFDAEYNFRITSIGSFGRTTREIIAISYDFDKVKERLKNLVKAEQQNPGASPTPSPAPGAPPGQPAQQQPAQAASKPGRPQVVYWFER